jgi:hypothetical protein
LRARFLTDRLSELSRLQPSGHSSIATTLNIYTHVVDASHRKAIEALERELFPSVPKLPDGPKPADSATRDFRVA